jgi:hypothetical protein
MAESLCLELPFAFDATAGVGQRSGVKVMGVVGKFPDRGNRWASSCVFRGSPVDPQGLPWERQNRGARYRLGFLRLLRGYGRRQ